MNNTIQLKCPHCGAIGNVIVPPFSAFIVGPCPECSEMMIVFAGNALPLDKDVVMNGLPEEREEHLLDVLTEFLREHLHRLFETLDAAGHGLPDMPGPESKDAASLEAMVDGIQPVSKDAHSTAPVIISQADMETFRNTELQLIDDSDYFKAVFG